MQGKFDKRNDPVIMFEWSNDKTTYTFVKHPLYKNR